MEETNQNLQKLSEDLKKKNKYNLSIYFLRLIHKQMLGEKKGRIHQCILTECY